MADLELRLIGAEQRLLDALPENLKDPFECYFIHQREVRNQASIDRIVKALKMAGVL